MKESSMEYGRKERGNYKMKIPKQDLTSAEDPTWLHRKSEIAIFTALC